jgi:hypothetical protein
MLDAPSALRLGIEERRGALTITLYGNKRPSNICSLHGSCLVPSLPCWSNCHCELQILDSTRLDSSFQLNSQNPPTLPPQSLPLPPFVFTYIYLFLSCSIHRLILPPTSILHPSRRTYIVTYSSIIDLRAQHSGSQSTGSLPRPATPVRTLYWSQEPTEVSGGSPKNKHPTPFGTWCIPVKSRWPLLGVMKWLP